MQFTTTTGPHDQMHLTPLLGEPPLLCPSLELWLVRSEIGDRGPTLDEMFTDPDWLPSAGRPWGVSPAFELPADEVVSERTIKRHHHHQAWPDAWLCAMMCAGGEDADPEPQQRAQGAWSVDAAELRHIEDYVKGLLDITKTTRNGEVFQLSREETKKTVQKYSGESLRMAINTCWFICMRMINKCGVIVGDREDFCQCIGGKKAQGGGGSRNAPSRALLPKLEASV